MGNFKGQTSSQRGVPEGAQPMAGWNLQEPFGRGQAALSVFVCDSQGRTYDPGNCDARSNLIPPEHRMEIIARILETEGKGIGLPGP
jgi:hypothetical protein